MPTPLIFVSTYKVKADKVEELKDYIERISDVVEAEEPQIIAFNAFLNDDGTEMTSVQVHPDTASMETHMEVLREAWDGMFARYTEFLEEGVSVAYYGTPAESALAMDRASGVPIDLKPRHLGGFTRATPGRPAGRGDRPG